MQVFARVFGTRRRQLVTVSTDAYTLYQTQTVGPPQKRHISKNYRMGICQNPRRTKPNKVKIPPLNPKPYKVLSLLLSFVGSLRQSVRAHMQGAQDRVTARPWTPGFRRHFFVVPRNATVATGFGVLGFRV